MIDTALLRPGRFDRIVFVAQIPTEERERGYWKFMLQISP